MKAPESSKKAISYPVKVLYWNGIPQIRPDGGNQEELFLFLSQFQENTKLNITLSEEDINTIERVSYQEGYEQAEKDINKEMMDRIAKIKEKQNEAALSDIDYKVYFEPTAGFDIGSAVVYHNDKIVDELTIKDLELLHTFLYAIKNNKQGAFTFTRLSDEQYQEVLRRFQEAKK